MNGVTNPGGDVEVKQFRSGAGEYHVERLDVTVDQPFVLQLRPLARFGLRQVAFATLSVQLLEACRIRMKSDERVQHIECDIYRLPVAKAPVSADELLERLPVNELGDEIPVAGIGLARPEDLHHVGMMDLPQGADLAAHRLIPGGAVEELERSLLTLDVIAYAIDLRKAALPEYLENLEAALEDVADGVVGRLDPCRGSHLCRVRFRERLAAG